MNDVDTGESGGAREGDSFWQATIKLDERCESASRGVRTKTIPLAAFGLVKYRRLPPRSAAVAEKLGEHPGHFVLILFYGGCVFRRRSRYCMLTVEVCLLQINESYLGTYP